MESDTGLPGDVADGAQVLGLVDSATAETPDLTGDISTEEESEAAAVDTSGTNGGPTSSNLLDPECSELEEAEGNPADSGNAEAEADEMDIDETAVGAVPEESAYIGDNCLSTPAVTEDNSPQDSEANLEPLLKESGVLDPDMAGEDQEESPDQSITSAMPIDSADGDGAPITQDGTATGFAMAGFDYESSTMDEEMGGGEGVASSDDVNDISSAAQEAIHTGISSSTAEAGADISSSDQAVPSLISSTANGPAQLHSLSLPQDSGSNEFGDADTSELDGGADDTMPSVSESMPLISMNANGSGLLSPSLLHGEESSAGGVSSSGGAGGAAAEGAGGAEAGVASAGGAGDEAAGGAGDEAAGGAGGDGAPLPPADAAHALATLASAALHHHPQTEPEEKQPQNEEDIWYTVGIVRGTNYTVQSYISDPNVDLSSLSLDNIPELSGLPTTQLEHGTAYRFRVAAVNSCGRGDFSEESAFKTCLPGYPGAPSAIKISKSTEGAHLSWEPPQVAAEGIFEYSVYLAVRSNNQHKQEASKSQLAFVRVYCGKTNTCVVPQSSLSAAHVDSSTKPAIIFRIAARNEKGYGPATQVRWLQDLKSTGVKRAGENRLPGASPSKQVKQVL